MTRINLIDPSELTDQHLFAEFREIKMVPRSLARSLTAAKRAGKSTQYVLDKIPAAFTLNTGHVTFFYDKGEYLRKRFEALRIELEHRCINFDMSSQLDQLGVFASLDERFNKDYVPTPEAISIIKARIAEKIAMKPDWYRYTGTGSVYTERSLA